MPQKKRQRPDPDVLRHQCEVEHLTIERLRIHYGYAGITDLYACCKEWGIKPYRNPRKWDHLRAIDFTPDQHQIVLGTMLGDGTINQDPRDSPNVAMTMRMVHGTDQLSYLEWKKERLQPFFPREAPRKSAQVNFNPEGVTYYRYTYDSIAHQTFTDYRHLFYPDGKRHVSQEILDRLGPLAVAVWFMDDGSHQRQSGWSMLATHSFSQSENEMAADWFQQFLGVRPKVYPNRKLQQWFMCFNRPAVAALQAKTKDHFFPPLLYKIGL